MLLVMVLTGALSYFLDNRELEATRPLQTASAKADEYIKRRIAEHELEAKQAATQPAVSAVSQKLVTVPVKATSQAQSSNGFFSRTHLTGAINFVKRIPRTRKFEIGAGALIALAFFVYFKRITRNADAPELESVIEKPTIESVPESPKESIPAAAERAMFSLYTSSDSSEDGSFVDTYLKPMFSSFRDGGKNLFARITRREQTIDVIHIFSSAMVSPIAEPLHQSDGASTGQLFRRAVLVKK